MSRAPRWPSGKGVRLERGGTGFNSRFLRRAFSRSSYTRDLQISTPVATLPGAWRYKIRAGTGWPGVSNTMTGKIKSLICNFCLSVAAREIV